MCCEDRLAAELRQRNMRMTPQREMVLRVLHDLPAGATAEEILQQVASLSPAVDLSTVYRSLDLFESLDLVSSYNGPNNERRYELLTIHQPHAHLQCQRCGKLQTIDLQTLDTVAAELLGSHRFILRSEHLVLPGICHTCSEQQSAASA
ncbi:MAG: transcriptional repressor [Chloroflexi bacterium]|nr:transcriptional repressor [Chloroflexota bacterium]